MTALIAKIAGPYLIVTALGFILSRAYYERMVAGSANADPILINLSGAVHFVIGMVILVNHFIWSTAAEIAVSVLGCIAVLKGAAMIAVPEMTFKTPKTVGTLLSAAIVSFLLAGLYFTFVGFGG